MVLATLIAACGDPTDPPVETGAIEVTVTTSGGAPDPDGYLLKIGSVELPMATEATIIIDDLATGEVSLAILGLSANCAVGAGFPGTVTVQPADTVPIQASISCPSGFGTLQLDVRMGGIDLDPDGFSVQVGTSGPHTVTPGGANEITGLPVGEHPVTLDGLARTCLALSPAPAVTIAADATVSMRVDVQCGWILATASPTGDEPDLHLVGVNGAWRRVGGAEGNEWSADWSPDLSEIVFTSGVGSCSVLKFLTLGETTARILDTPGCEYQPSWSRATNRIAYMGGQNTHIYVIDPDGTGAYEVMPDHPWGQSDPAFSPDGTRIAFNGFGSQLVGGERADGLWVVNVDGTGLTRLTEGAEIATPEWSPDGSEIAFAAGMGGDVVYQIYAIRPDGTGLRKLTHDLPGFLHPAWSPGGTHLAVTRLDDAGWKLFTIRADGTDLTEVPLTREPASHATTDFERSHDWLR